jgi:hypothetical protein
VPSSAWLTERSYLVTGDVNRNGGGVNLGGGSSAVKIFLPRPI